MTVNMEGKEGGVLPRNGGINIDFPIMGINSEEFSFLGKTMKIYFI